MRDGDYPYPDVQLAAWNITEGKLCQRYFPTTYLKLHTTSILPVGLLCSADR